MADDNSQNLNSWTQEICKSHFWYPYVFCTLKRYIYGSQIILVYKEIFAFKSVILIEIQTVCVEKQEVSFTFIILFEYLFFIIADWFRCAWHSAREHKGMTLSLWSSTVLLSSWPYLFGLQLFFFSLDPIYDPISLVFNCSSFNMTLSMTLSLCSSTVLLSSWPYLFGLQLFFFPHDPISLVFNCSAFHMIPFLWLIRCSRNLDCFMTGVMV